MPSALLHDRKNSRCPSPARSPLMTAPVFCRGYDEFVTAITGIVRGRVPDSSRRSKKFDPLSLSCEALHASRADPTTSAFTSDWGMLGTTRLTRSPGTNRWLLIVRHNPALLKTAMPMEDA